MVFAYAVVEREAAFVSAGWPLATCDRVAYWRGLDHTPLPALGIWGDCSQGRGHGAVAVELLGLAVKLLGGWACHDGLAAAIMMLEPIARAPAVTSAHAPVLEHIASAPAVIAACAPRLELITSGGTRDLGREVPGSAPGEASVESVQSNWCRLDWWHHVGRC